MKQVINKKKYNTETAKLLHEWNNRMFGNDFRSCKESLYKTKNRAYFICGSGGAMSKYAKQYGNSISGGNRIEVLTEAEAMEWLENYDGTEALVEFFGNQIEEA